MKHLLERIKKYKWGFIGLAIIVILLILLIVFGEKPLEPGLSPVITDTPPTPAKDKVVFLRAEPPSGRRESPDTFATVIFEFSLPIDIHTINIYTKPFLKLEKRVYEHSPNKLYVWPATHPWQDTQEYKVIIKSLKATSGESLGEPVVYTYYNEAPEKVYGGEDWMLEESNTAE